MANLTSVASTLKPSAVGIDSQKGKLSSVEQKTDAAGRAALLQFAAIVSAMAGVIGAVVYSPVYVGLIVTAIALAILAEQKPADDGSFCPALNDFSICPRAPFIPGQPVGLRNAGANCWANAFLQMIAHVPSWREPVLAEGNKNASPFFDFIQAYDRAQRGESYAVPREQFDSQQIRSWCHAQDPIGFSNNPYVHQDATDLVYLFLKHYNKKADFIRRADFVRQDQKNGGLVQEEQKESIFLFPIGKKESTTLDELMDEFFNHQLSPNHGGKQQHRWHLAEAPQEFCMAFARFEQNERQGIVKASTLIKDGLTYELPERYLQERQQQQPAEEQGFKYTCDLFIVHTGEAIQGGHYVTYVKKESGWWRCDDRDVTQVSERAAKEEMEKSYFCHFVRT